MVDAPQKFFHLDVLIPTGELYSGTTSLVTLPGSEGYFGVLADHAPLIASLKAGLITIAHGDHQFFVTTGIVEVTPDQVTVFADHAVDTKTIDLRLKRAELEELTVRAKSSPSDDLAHDIHILETMISLLDTPKS